MSQRELHSRTIAGIKPDRQKAPYAIVARFTRWEPVCSVRRGLGRDAQPPTRSSDAATAGPRCGRGDCATRKTGRRPTCAESREVPDVRAASGIDRLISYDESLAP